MNRKFFALSLLGLSFLVMAGCGVKIQLQDENDEQVAPPVEGEDSAPPVETSAEEILITQLTPTGVMALAEDNISLGVFDHNGTQLAFMQAPGIGSGDTQNLHLAGGWTSGALPPLVYRGWEPEQAILQSINGVASTLRATNSFIALAGAGGQPAFAFSEAVFESNNSVSRLYAGTQDSIGSAAAFYEITDVQMGMVLMPVAVEAAGGQPQGVWYVQTAWGIGGIDLIFPINRGLYFYDLTSGENSMALDLNRSFQGISPDQRWAASVEFNSGKEAKMAVQNLETGQSIEFPPNPATDRGAGYAVFSPDGQYVAWLEASGSLTGDPPFQPRVRVGDLGSGGVVAEADKNEVAQALGWSTVSWLKTAGFLDERTLVIEARGADWGTVSLLKYDFAADRLIFLCQGSFAGFTYP